MSEPTPALAADKATVEDALDLHALTLIGLIEGYDGPAALLRSSQGQIARVITGQEAFGATVVAIDTEQVVLTDRWGRSQTLALPLGG